MAATMARVGSAVAAIFATASIGQVPGISDDRGYQQYMIAPVEALVPIPASLQDLEAAPLLCAGVTTYNALRRSGAFPGDLVAVQGIGGLGHLGIQFANRFGYKVAAIGRGSDTAALATELGASVYIDSASTKPAERFSNRAAHKSFSRLPQARRPCPS
jgi:D-arabinose 1-dehydrogenase-like Zn-dependent alcohol dehydrogenase